MRLSWLFLVAGCVEYGYHDKSDPVATDTADPMVDTGDPLTTPTTSPTPTTPTTTSVVTTPTVTTPTTTSTTTTDPTPPADAPVYANTSTELFEVEPETGVRTLVGSFNHDGRPVDQMVDIAIDLRGGMYGGTYEALYRIDPTNATLTKICDTDLKPYALAFDSTGVLYAGAGESVVSVDLSTCDTAVLLVSAIYETSGDLVGLPDGYLYWTVSGDENDDLVRIDPSTGGTTWVGPIAAQDLYGLGYDQDQLYGFSSRGEIVRISPIGAASSITSEDPSISWWGATTNPVVW
jgi:hypothetical protein